MAGPGTLGEPAGGEHGHRRQNVVVTIDVSHVSGVLLRTGGDEQVGNGDPVTTRVRELSLRWWRDRKRLSVHSAGRRKRAKSYSRLS